MTPLCVLGIGSPLGYDRIGWMAARYLADEILAPFPQVSVESCDRPGVALLDRLRGARAAWLVDAMQAGLAAGTLVRLNAQDIRTRHGLFSSHGFGLAQALTLGSALGDLPAQVTVYGIQIPVGEGAPRTEAEMAGLPWVRQALRDLGAALLSDLEQFDLHVNGG